MQKRFYLATQKDRAAEAEPLPKALDARGWKRTYTWTNDQTGVPPDLSQIALAELQGVRDADVLIVLLPGGYGTHVEIGAALALGKPVILYAENQKVLETPYACPFHYHPGVRLVVSGVLNADEILAHLPTGD